MLKRLVVVVGLGMVVALVAAVCAWQLAQPDPADAFPSLEPRYYGPKYAERDRVVYGRRDGQGKVDTGIILQILRFRTDMRDLSPSGNQRLEYEDGVEVLYDDDPTGFPRAQLYLDKYRFEVYGPPGDTQGVAAAVSGLLDMYRD